MVPNAARKYLNQMYSKVPFPYIYGITFVSYYNWLMKTQWLPIKDLEEIQNKMLIKIINYSYEHVPYYQKLFKKLKLDPTEIKSKYDLKLLPILTEKDIRNNYSDLLANNSQSYAPIINHTSGSTGIPLKFQLDKKNWIIEKAFVCRHWSWMGYDPRENQVILRGKVPDNGTYYKNDNNLFLSSFNLNNLSVKGYVEMIDDFNPKLIRGYPSSLFSFANLLKEQNICPKPQMAVQTSSETLLPFMRKNIEHIFKSKVFDSVRKR